MVITLNLITSFIASGAFGMIFNAPKRTLLHCGLVGMLGWIAYIMLDLRMETIFSTVIATFIVGVISQLFAKLCKKPVIIFSVSGIIPLVPGGLAYDAMRNFVSNDYNAAIQLAAQAFLISGSIAIGLVMSEVLNQLLRKIPVGASVRHLDKGIDRGMDRAVTEEVSEEVSEEAVDKTTDETTDKTTDKTT